MTKASELKPFKVTYKTTSGKESTCTIKARDEKEAKAKCRSKPNYAGNAVATLKEAEYNKDAVDKEIKKAGVGKKGAKNIHKLLKGHSGKKDEVKEDYSDESNDKVMRWFQKTFGNTSMTMIRSDDYHEFDHYDNTIEVGNPGGVWYYAVKIDPRDPNHKKFVKQIRNKIESGLFESKLTEGVLDDVDDDGFMAKRQLYDLAKYSVELHRMIQDTDNLEPWVQAKITKAADYIDTVKHYLEYSGVRDAEATADVMGPPEMADIDAVGGELDSMLSMETEVMEYGDEDEGSEVHAEDVLHWAELRGIIGPGGHSEDMFLAAQDVADSIGRVWEIGSSDVSIWMREFVNTAKGYGVILDGEKAHLYESQLKAKMIYRNMLRELREKK